MLYGLEHSVPGSIPSRIINFDLCTKFPGEREKNMKNGEV